MRRLAAAGIALVLAVLAMPATANAAPQVLRVAPGATGPACTTAAPCGKIDKAISLARPGDTIELAAGTYLPETLRHWTWMDTATVAVTIRPVPGAAVTLAANTASPDAKWQDHSGWLTWQDISVTGVPFFIYGDAPHTTIERARFTGSQFFVRASDATVRDSTLTGGYTCPGDGTGCGYDGITISASYGSPAINRVLIEGNTIHDYQQGGFSGLHADCIQLYDVDGVTIRGNRMSDCYNKSITISPGNNRGVRGVLIEANVLENMSIDLVGGGTTNIPQTEIRLYNNTITGGFRQRADNPEVYVGNNIIGRASDCIANTDPGDGPNYIAEWNLGLCSTYPTGLGNVYGPLPTTPPLGADPRLTPGADVNGRSYLLPAVFGAEETRTSC